MILATIINAIRLGVHLLRAKLETIIDGPLTAKEVDDMLSAAAKSVPEATDWRVSIVDLLKVLRLDSSLTARKRLAEELGYTGNPNGSAEMNMWLHVAVMKQVAEHEFG